MISEHVEAPRAAPLVTYRRAGRGLRRRYGQDAWGHASAAQPAASSLAPYVAFAKAWWWLILIGLIVGLGATAAYLRFGPIPHRSLAYILVPPQENPGSDSLGSPALLERAAGNFAVQAGSPYVMGLVASALPPGFGLNATDMVRMVQSKDVDIRQHRGSSLISVSVTEQRPEVARTVADTIVRVFSKDVNDRAASQLDQRRKHLTEQIEATRQQLQTAQLNQRERDLARQLQEQRSQLLQVQAQHQLQLQLQAEAQRQAQPAAAPPPASPSLTPEQTRLLQSSIQNRVEALRLLTQQQVDTEANIARLNEELVAVRTTLAQLPAADSEDIQQQQAAVDAERLQIEEQRRLQEERTRLTQQEAALNRELQNLRAQMLQVQTQSQQELQRQADADRQTRLALTPTAGQPPLPPQERQRIQDLANAATAVRTQAIQLLDEQRKEIESKVVLATGQLAEVRASLAALPAPDPSISVVPTAPTASTSTASPAATPPILVGPVSQLRAERQRLEQREQAILVQQQGLRTQLLQLHQLQAQSQQEVQRLLEDQRVAAAPPAATGGAQRSPALQDLAAATVSSRGQWLRILAEQQREVEQNIAVTTQQIGEVRQALAQRPASTDPALDAAFTQAFAAQLGELTAEYASLQMNAGIVTAPLVPYGTATEALPTIRAKRTLALGAAGGLAGGAGLAYALHLLRQARSRRVASIVPPAASKLWSRPSGTLRAPDETPSPVRLAGNGGRRNGAHASLVSPGDARSTAAQPEPGGAGAA